MMMMMVMMVVVVVVVVAQVAEEVLAMSISLTPEQIRELAQQINEAISGLTNIDVIIEETRADLQRARDLERRANNAKLDDASFTLSPPDTVSEDILFSDVQPPHSSVRSFVQKYLVTTICRERLELVAVLQLR